MKVQSYKRESALSYALGVTVTVELLLRRPAQAEAVLLHPALEDGPGKRRLLELCAAHGVPVETGEKPFRILSQKENCFAIGVFRKYDDPPRPGARQVLLVCPSNAGNLGTILRTMAGFGVVDLSILPPAADLWDPRVVRASMGAVFQVRSAVYPDFDAWRAAFPDLPCFPFMLTASVPLKTVDFPDPCALVFGNEAAGLPDEYARRGRAVVIPHGAGIDSLNLPTAAGIALYELTKKDW